MASGKTENNHTVNAAPGDSLKKEITVSKKFQKETPLGSAAGLDESGAVRDSTIGVDPKVAALVSISFLIFVAYIAFRVRKSLKDDER